MLLERILVLGLASALAACGSAEPQAPLPVPADAPSYTGGEACGSCHEQELALWRGSHHDLAMQEATDETVLGDFDGATLTHFGAASSFHRRGERFVVRTDGPDGARREYPVAYTFGVHPLQQYLVRFPDGRLQVLPLAWDSRPRDSGGQRWFHLHPDERIAAGDPLHWTGREQTWNFMCAECHSTGLRKGYSLEEDRYATTWQEIDVSCEACHGPGSAHAAWAERVARGEETPEPDMGLRVRFARTSEVAWIFEADAAIARRSPPRESRGEVEACGRCHSRRSLLSETDGHGRPLLDTHRPALLDESLYHADGQIDGEVYVYGSFLQSRMYAAGVSCSDCHEAHALTLRAQGNALCGRCHLAQRYDTPEHHFHPAGKPGSQCVDCHMPAKLYMVVDPRHDHSFRVPRPDLSERLGTPDLCTDCHRDRSASWAAAALRERFGPERGLRPHFGEALAAARSGAASAERSLADLADDTGQPGIARATALRLLRDHLGSGSAATVERALRDGDPLVRAAALEATEALGPRERLRVAGPLLRDPVRGVRTEAARVLAPVPPELWRPAARVALADALAEYRAAQLANADRPESHLNLGALRAALREYDEARADFETALRLAPDFIPARVNLADALRQQGRDAEGEAVLREALRIDPNGADAHHALGLLLVRQRRLPEALVALGRAAELAPERARYAYVHAVALGDSGEPDRALSLLRAAHERHPGDRSLLLELAVLSRARGALAEAREYARKLAERSPRDPEARALVRSLEPAER